MKLRRSGLWLTLVILGAFLIYSLISLVNHYNFRTYALDVGAYTNALYDYLHFQWNDSTVFKVEPENLLADHFDLYLILFSPLYLLLGSYTLSIVQIIFLCIGGLGVYQYFNDQKDKFIQRSATIYFLIFFGVISSLTVGYHSNVITASLVPWFFLFVKMDRWKPCIAIFLFLLIGKENMSLWICFICLGLIIQYWNNQKYRFYLSALSIVAILYFILITKVIMPGFSNAGTYPHFHYSVLGDDYFSVIKSLIYHPIESLELLFINHSGNANYDFIKLELHLLLVFSGLLVLMRKPHFLIMLLPIYFQKLYHDNPAMWAYDGQYSIEFAPVMAIGIFSFFGELSIKESNRKIIMVMLVSLTAICTIRNMDRTYFFSDKTRVRIYAKEHFLRDYPVSSVHEQLDMIPDESIVSAQSALLPHLALRDNIYQFPMVKDAEYIVVSPKD